MQFLGRLARKQRHSGLKFPFIFLIMIKSWPVHNHERTKQLFTNETTFQEINKYCILLKNLEFRCANRRVPNAQSILRHYNLGPSDLKHILYVLCIYILSIYVHHLLCKCSSFFGNSSHLRSTLVFIVVHRSITHLYTYRHVLVYCTFFTTII